MEISKETLQIEFLSNRDTLVKIKGGDNSRIVEYYAKKYGYSSDGNKVINDFIEENLYILLENENKDLSIEDIKEWLKNINNYDVYEYADGLIDIYDEDVIKSYNYFQLFIENNDLDEGVIEVIKVAQYDGYSDLFNNIKDEFVLFLENKADEVE